MLLLLAAVALASTPLVVRITDETTALTAPVVVTATAGEEKADINLNDQGEAPDVAAGDGRWAGKVELDGKLISLQLSVGGKSLGSSSVEFETADGPRDVDLHVENGALVAVGSLPPDGGGPPAEGGAGGAPPAGGEAGPLEGGGPPAGQAAGGGGAGGADGDRPGAGSRPAGVTFPASRTTSSGLYFIAFGVGILVMLGVAWLWLRRGGSAGVTRPADLVPVAEPGLFHPALPSVSDGLSAWFVDDVGAFLPPLLAHLAEHHRVLVVGRASLSVPPVRGGPVYRLVGIKPSGTGEAVRGLAEVPGPPVVVVFVLDTNDHALVRELRDALPPEVGGIALLPAVGEVAVPSVRALPSPRGWSLQYGEVRVDVVSTDRGLARASTA